MRILVSVGFIVRARSRPPLDMNAMQKYLCSRSLIRPDGLTLICVLLYSKHFPDYLSCRYTGTDLVNTIGKMNVTLPLGIVLSALNFSVKSFHFFSKLFMSRNKNEVLPTLADNSAAEKQQVISASVKGVKMENMKMPVRFTLPNPTVGIFSFGYYFVLYKSDYSHNDW